MRKRWRDICALLAALLVFALPSFAAESLTVYAAASLKDALEQIAKQHEARTGERVTLVLAASSNLAKQIENGARADVFVSADEAWMDYLAQRQRVQTASRVAIIGNRLVLIAPAASTVALQLTRGVAIAQALGDGRLALADPAHVPAGRYAQEALAPLGVWEAVKNRLAPAENVRAAMNFVARGEAPLGIVYRSDALADTRVRIVDTFPVDSHKAIVYPAALVAGARPEAKAFLDALRSAESRTVFTKFGFAPLN